VSNISPDENRPYEDWFVHRDEYEKVKHLVDTSDKTKCAENFMFGAYNE
jgi:hypothetical protein